MIPPIIFSRQADLGVVMISRLGSYPLGTLDIWLDAQAKLLVKEIGSGDVILGPLDYSRLANSQGQGFITAQAALGYAVAAAAAPVGFAGSGDYPAGTVTDTLNLLIDNKVDNNDYYLDYVAIFDQNLED